MNNLVLSLLNAKDVTALINAHHHDVFSVLGMHKHPSEKGLIVRALLPEALNVDVIDRKNNKAVASLSLVHPTGLFEGKLGQRRNAFNYRLRVEYPK